MRKKVNTSVVKIHFIDIILAAILVLGLVFSVNTVTVSNDEIKSPTLKFTSGEKTVILGNLDADLINKYFCFSLNNDSADAKPFEIRVTTRNQTPFSMTVMDEQTYEKRTVDFDGSGTDTALVMAGTAETGIYAFTMETTLADGGVRNVEDISVSIKWN